MRGLARAESVLTGAAAAASGESFGATAQSRVPRIAAISARLAASRRGESKNINVVLIAAKSPSAFRRAPDFGGRKPANIKLLLGRPESVRAMSAAFAPGTAET